MKRSRSAAGRHEDPRRATGKRPVDWRRLDVRMFLLAAVVEIGGLSAVTRGGWTAMVGLLACLGGLAIAYLAWWMATH